MAVSPSSDSSGCRDLAKIIVKSSKMSIDNTYFRSNIIYFMILSILLNSNSIKARPGSATKGPLRIRPKEFSCELNMKFVKEIAKRD